MKNFLLYSCCFPIAGYTRGCIVDTQKGKVHLISNRNIKQLNEKKISTDKINTKALDFLLKEEILFEIDISLKDMFPPISLEWDYPSIITNAIVSVNNNINIEEILLILDKIKLPNLVLQIKENHKKLLNISDIFTYFRSVKFILYKNVSSIFERKIRKCLNKDGFPVFRKLKNSKNCNINKTNILLFTESKKHHTYFNRKLYIGADGEIKNAPECEEEFGNIKNLKNAEELKEIIVKPKFQKYWFVHKELCDVCKRL